MKASLTQVEEAVREIVSKTGSPRVSSIQVLNHLERTYRTRIDARSANAHLRFLYESFQGEYLVHSNGSGD